MTQVQNTLQELKQVTKWDEQKATLLLKAIEQMVYYNKVELASVLINMKHEASSDEEREAIEFIIKELTKDDVLWESLRDPIVRIKGWVVTGSGRVADFFYNFGDKTDTLVTKGMNVFGDVLIFLGKQCKKHAPMIGDIVAKPIRLMGDMAEAIHKQNQNPKKEV